MIYTDLLPSFSHFTTLLSTFKQRCIYIAQTNVDQISLINSHSHHTHRYSIRTCYTRKTFPLAFQIRLPFLNHTVCTTPPGLSRLRMIFTFGGNEPCDPFTQLFEFPLIAVVLTGLGLFRM